MDDPRPFSVRLIGPPHDQYKYINLDLCISKAHVLKLQLVFLVLFMVTQYASCVHEAVLVFQQTTNGYEKNSQAQ
jgi:hypothetical protein